MGAGGALHSSRHFRSTGGVNACRRWEAISYLIRDLIWADSFTLSALRRRRPSSSDARLARPLRDAHPPTTHHELNQGDEGDRRTLLAWASVHVFGEPQLTKCDRFGSREGSGSAADILLVRVSVVRPCVCVCARVSWPDDVRPGVWAFGPAGRTESGEASGRGAAAG
jgi:hypothetical protein